MAKTKKISKQEASRCASVVAKYAQQQTVAGAKKGATATAKAAKRLGKATVNKLKSYFK